MKPVVKILIVVVLAAVVTGLLIMKQAQRREAPRAGEAVPTAGQAAARLEAQAPALPSAPQAALPRLIDLGADKCIPCKAMAPILAELRTALADRVTVEFIDVWQKPDDAEPYRIKLIPTQIFLDAAGNELFRHEGFFSKEDILAKWKELGVACDPQP